MSLPRLSFRAALGTLLVLLAACESRPERREMMEEARHEVPPMAANQPFFDGTVVAYLTLGNELDSRGGPEGDVDKTGAQTGNGGGRRGGGRGGMGRGAGRSSRDSDDQGGERGGSGSLHRSAMPPALLRLRLANTTQAVIEVEVRELNSELGDFAVRPDKLTLQPGQSGDTDPMESLLGVDTYSLPVSLTLRSAGRTETKVLTLELVKPAPAVPTPNPGH